jgi:hypothetical protein
LKKQYLAFDLEIVKSLPEGFDDWREHRPLGISCAATLTSDGELTVWYGHALGGGISERMERDDLNVLLAYLEAGVEAGFTILTWNGLGFDFDVLAEESDALERCKLLAVEHVDMMFHIFCELGFPLGLDRVAKGMGLEGKRAGMSGALAPVLWGQGKRKEVLEYVAQDARTTLDVAQTAEQYHQLRWISKSGRPQSMPLPFGWMTIQEALQLPEPDTSWMSHPWSRRHFLEWMDKVS